MLRHLAKGLRKFTTALPSLQQGSARPTNALSTRNAIDVYNDQGEIASRTYLVLKEKQQIDKYVLNLFRNYYRTSNKSKVSLESTLADHGLDSLDAVELVVRMEDELGYVVPGEALRCFATIKAFCNYIKQTEDFKEEFKKEPIN